LFFALLQALSFSTSAMRTNPSPCLAEGAAGREGDLGLVHHPQAEVDRALRPGL
jgi:hypothetical protein